MILEMQISRSKHKWTYVVVFKLSFIAVYVLFEIVVYLVLKETIKKFDQGTFFSKYRIFQPP